MQQVGAWLTIVVVVGLIVGLVVWADGRPQPEPTRWISTTVLKHRSGTDDDWIDVPPHQVILRTGDIVQAVVGLDGTTNLMLVTPQARSATVYAVTASPDALCAALGCEKLVDSAEYSMKQMDSAWRDLGLDSEPTEEESR